MFGHVAFRVAWQVGLIDLYVWLGLVRWGALAAAVAFAASAVE